MQATQIDLITAEIRCPKTTSRKTSLWLLEILLQLLKTSIIGLASFHDKKTPKPESMLSITDDLTLLKKLVFPNTETMLPVRLIRFQNHKESHN